MNSKIFVIIVILSLFCVIPSVNAQLSLGDKANQELIQVTIDSTDKITVKHIVKPSNFPVSVNLIEGTILDIVVTNENNEEVEFGLVGDNHQIMIFPTEKKSIIKYNLEDVVLQNDGMKSIEIKYEQKISIITPKNAHLIYVNDTAILLNDKKGLNCHGCNITLRYFENDVKSLQQVNWEEKEFFIEMYTNSEINNFAFSQQTKSISFNVENKDKFITILLPLELLWEPYSVFLDDEKIKVQKISISDSHVLLNMKPKTSGTISIIGTTVIPEFPIIAPLAIGFLMILVIPFMKKINLR